MSRNGAVPDDVARTTYRYLRVAIVALALLLTVSLVLEIVWGGGMQFGSISGFYYSPVQAVFVGTLVAIGPALIALRGRLGWEDSLLDLAGIVIPLVALVPTPIELDDGGCGDRASCVPSDLEPAVVNNVTAALVVGAAVLAFYWWSAALRGRPVRLGLWIGIGAWLAFAVWFWVGRESFLVGAHYAAAITFFLLVSAVAWLHGRDVVGRQDVPGLSVRGYARSYRAIGGLMVVTLVLTGAVLGLGAWLEFETPFATIFVVEAVLLALFVAFWILQTVENWEQEAVEELGPAPEASVV